MQIQKIEAYRVMTEDGEEHILHSEQEAKKFALSREISEFIRKKLKELGATNSGVANSSRLGKFLAEIAPDLLALLRDNLDGPTPMPSAETRAIYEENANLQAENIRLRAEMSARDAEIDRLKGLAGSALLALRESLHGTPDGEETLADLKRRYPKRRYPEPGPIPNSVEKTYASGKVSEDDEFVAADIADLRFAE